MCELVHTRVVIRCGGVCCKTQEFAELKMVYYREGDLLIEGVLTCTEGCSLCVFSYTATIKNAVFV